MTTTTHSADDAGLPEFIDRDGLAQLLQSRGLGWVTKNTLKKMAATDSGPPYSIVARKATYDPRAALAFFRPPATSAQGEGRAA